MNKVSKLLLAAAMGLGWAAITPAAQAEMCWQFCDAQVAGNTDADTCWRWCSTAYPEDSAAVPCAVPMAATAEPEAVVYEARDPDPGHQANALVATKAAAINNRVAFDIED